MTNAPIPPITGLVTVEVEHRHFDRLEGGQDISNAINGGGGWALLLENFAKTVYETS